MFCQKCGRANPPYATFCSNCGHNMRTCDDNGQVHNINFNIGRQYNPYKTNTYAIWSMILACVSFVFGWGVVAVAAIILGNAAKNQISMSNEQGENLATMGIVLGWINVALTILGIFLLFIFTASFYAYII